MTNVTSSFSQIPDAPPDGQQRVLIVGGSTRSAAASAIRAGFRPVCADLFADLDTRQLAEVIPVRDFPDSLPDDVADVRADVWFFTGALENRPDLIERLQRPDAPYGPLWGTSPAALRLIRNPFWVAETLSGTGWPSLEVLPQSSRPPVDGSWMRKPISSAGGRAVCVWDDRTSQRDMVEPVYFQRRRHGDTLSALYHCDGHAVEFIGMTRQLTGHELSGATEPFAYCGSIGPLRPDSLETGSFERTRRALTGPVKLLATRSGLRGIFGVDFIRDRQGTPWIVEVNPRYTASVEIMELALRQPLLTRSGMQASTRRLLHPDAIKATPVVAKMILYARSSFTAPDMTPDSGKVWECRSEWEIHELADVPVPGTRIEASWPVCTVLAMAPTEAECLQRLHDRVDSVWKMVNHRAHETAKRLPEPRPKDLL